MSVVESDATARATGADGEPRNRQESAHPLRWRDDGESNPYSPVLCISLLLIIGLIITVGPAIKAYLAAWTAYAPV